MSDRTSRRTFLKGAAATTGAVWWLGQPFADAVESKSPNQRINFASIGVGGKGDEDCSDAGKFGNLAAICDVDDNKLAKKGSVFKTAQRFNDFREMLDKLGDKIDAVTVSTPDHTHAVASIAAMKLGKHCFTQKPLTWSLEEARRMREISAEKKVCTQMGNQGTAASGFREGVEKLRAGVIGNVTEIHVWTDRPKWPQGTGRLPSQPVPAHLHWDLFLGPAPVRAYNEKYHPFNWRGVIDFGTGALGDMGCHTANLAVMALELFDPTLVEVKKSAGIVENETYPKNSVIESHFPQRGKLPPCKLIWYDGQNYPPNELLQGEDARSASGMLFIGSEGTMYTSNDYGEAQLLLPKPKFKDYKAPEKSLPRSPGHFKEFVDACQQNKPELAMSNFGYAGRLTETILLGNLALRAGKPIEWDAKNMKVTNDEAANKLVRREYREGYSI